MFALAFQLTDQLATGQLVLTVLLAVAGFTCLLPKPRGRYVALGMALSLLSLVVGMLFIATTFGGPIVDYVGTILFWLFAGAAITFGGLLIAQSNPARGAIAFAFLILSTCGLFLLLAAPFLMAATVIVYMGAIVVTFLFVLMLSHAHGPSDENDRSREPLLGSLAGFGFAGLVLFALYTTSPMRDGASRINPSQLPQPAISAAEFATLTQAASELELALRAEPSERQRLAEPALRKIATVVEFQFPSTDSTGADSRVTLQDRSRVAAAEARIAALIAQADRLRDAVKRASGDMDEANLVAVREQSLLLAGRGELSARNVFSVGLILYSEHLLAVELAGTLLTVAAIGAVAVTGRKEDAA